MPRGPGQSRLCVTRPALPQPQVVAATRLGHEEVPGLYAIFRHLDVDRSGHLSVDELRVGLQRQGKTVSEVGRSGCPVVGERAGQSMR